MFHPVLRPRIDLNEFYSFPGLQDIQEFSALIDNMSAVGESQDQTKIDSFYFDIHCFECAFID